MARAIARCGWCGTDPLYVRYHDEEWGVPVHDDRKLFEFLLLEGAQAGLSWITVLRKRDAYRQAFAGFDPERVARFNARNVESLLRNPGIVRNRLKVKWAVTRGSALILHLDTSALVKLYVRESGSRETRDRLEAASLAATARVAYPEARAALARRRREGAISKAALARAVSALDRDLARFVIAPAGALAG